MNDLKFQECKAKVADAVRRYAEEASEDLPFFTPCPLGPDITKEQLKEWLSDQSVCHFDDKLHRYFGKNHKESDWIEIGKEGVSLWNFLFEDCIEDSSPAEDLVLAVAAQVEESTIYRLAQAIGVPFEELRMFYCECVE